MPSKRSCIKKLKNCAEDMYMLLYTTYCYEHLFSIFALVGYYLYVEDSAPTGKTDYASLASPWYSQSLSTCGLSFWYHMYGQSTNQLNVYIRYKGSTLTRIFTASGNKGNRWLNAVVKFGTIPKFQV